MKKVYIICSRKQNEILIFSSRKRAENWIKNNFNDIIFYASSKDDLYISERVVF